MELINKLEEDYRINIKMLRVKERRKIWEGNEEKIIILGRETKTQEYE